MGTGAGLWVQAELRRRWRPLLILAVLCAVVVTVVLAAVAGARRTTTAYDRFLTEANAGHADVQMIAGMRGRTDVDLGNGKSADDVIAELRRLPEVEAVDRGVALQLGPRGVDFFTAVSLDGYAVNRPLLLDGRLPRGLGEMALNRPAVEALGKGVGDSVELLGWHPRQAERLMLEGDTSVLQEQPGGPRLALRVVGVVQGPGDIGRVDLSGPSGVIPPELYRRHGDDIAQFAPVVSVRLKNGDGDVPALNEVLRRFVGESEILSVEGKETDVDAVNDALDVQALALLLFAGVAGAAGLVSVATALARQLAASGADCSILHALGLTRRQRAVAVATVAAPVAIVGVVGGVAGAVAASPLLPIGLGASADPQTGLSFDAALPLGALALAVVLAGTVGMIAWQASRVYADDGEPAARQSLRLVNRWISKAGLGAVAATGLRLAFEPGSRTRPVPTRAALTAAVFATTAVVAVLVFGASLANVVSKPELSGFPWDAAALGGESLEDAEETIAAVVADPAVEAVTLAELSETVLAGKRTQLIGTRAAKGSAGLTLLEGRAPAAPDEVAVGPKTLERLDKSLSDSVELATEEEGGARRYRIVGTAGFPILNFTDYDNGAWLTSEGLAELQATEGNATVLVRLDPGADDATKRGELEELGFDFENAAVPAKVANLDEAEGFPQALAAFLAVLGLVTVGHALASSPRRRRRELAVLRTLGLVRWQVRLTFVVQATAVIAVGLAVGLPLGTAAGRSLWGAVASGISVVRRPVVPTSVLLVVPAAFVVANAMAVLPGRRAASVRPAEILRAE